MPLICCSACDLGRSNARAAELAQRVARLLTARTRNSYAKKNFCFGIGRAAGQAGAAAVRHYPSLPAYLEAEGWQNVAPHLHSFEETLAAYREFYSDAAVAAGGGMNAIQIEVIA